MKKTKLSYKTVLILLVSATLFTMLNGVDKRSFLSVPLFISLLYIGLNPSLLALSFISAFAVDFSLEKIFCSILVALIICPVFSIVKKRKKEVGAKIIPLTIIAVTPFALFSDNLEFSAIQGALCVMLATVFVSSSRVIFVKNFKYKCALTELTCLTVFTVIVAIGFINLFGFNAYRSVTLFAITCCAFAFSKGATLILAITLAVAPTVITFNFNYFATLSITGLISSLFAEKSKFLTALATLLLDVLFLSVLNLYGDFYYLDTLYSIVPVCLFLFLPTKLYLSFRRKAQNLNDSYLTKFAVNRTRLAISQKLYELAGVFSQIKQGFESLKNDVGSSEELFFKMAEEVIIDVCENCPSFEVCKNKHLPDCNELKNIISVGVAKGRISLIDLTKKFVSECGYVNSVIFEINALITKYREKVNEQEELGSGKELITMQSEGVSSVLKNLALDFSKTLSLSESLEDKLSLALHQNGIIYKEIMALENDCGLEVVLTFDTALLNLSKTEKVISNAIGVKMGVCSKIPLSLSTCAVSLRTAPLLDAAFGLSSTKKFGSEKSGDTHSLVKIDEGKFMVCISDGMGSGTQASKTSKTAISLIESFYKAGIDGNSVLGIVNKILAIGQEESFSAMDILTVNLFNLSCDFIKIGSPSSFIITEQSIRIVDGGSLPLGILDDIKPTSVSLPLTEGATVLMVTDGISDAFGSSTDIINFLKGLKSLNPQKLADDVLDYALKQENGRAKDDMTALAVRIFKKAS
ncbi:MAG: SpoIIE family protein phosphatase [Clostridia bacterium]|nr:SpoIIE family protein phosphatase [Clostridia bacterium]